jgi:hypothetical protein
MSDVERKRLADAGAHLDPNPQSLLKALSEAALGK